jgi:phosphocarrier protein
MPKAQQEVEIVNRLGLHARAAARFAAVASEYQAEVLVRRGDREVNGKSIMGLMMLAAARGATLSIACDGEDADAALERLCRLVAARFEEEE